MLYPAFAKAFYAQILKTVNALYRLLSFYDAILAKTAGRFLSRILGEWKTGLMGWFFEVSAKILKTYLERLLKFALKA